MLIFFKWCHTIFSSLSETQKVRHRRKHPKSIEDNLSLTWICFVNFCNGRELAAIFRNVNPQITCPIQAHYLKSKYIDYAVGLFQIPKTQQGTQFCHNFSVRTQWRSNTLQGKWSYQTPNHNQWYLPPRLGWPIPVRKLWNILIQSKKIQIYVKSRFLIQYIERKYIFHNVLFKWLHGICPKNFRNGLLSNSFLH